MEKQRKRRIKLWKPIVAVVILAVLVLLLLGILRFGTIIFLFWIVPWLAGKIAQSTGMAIQLAYALSIVLSVAIVYILSLLYRKRTRKAGLALALVTFVVFSLGLWYVERDYVFSPEGTPVRCVAETPYGYEYVSCSWKYHPLYGTEVKPATKEFATQRFVEEKGLPRVSRLAVSKNVSFFSPDGKPLAWYYKHDDGKLEFFSRPGKHPQFNVDLAPVNPQIVNLLFSYLDEGRTDMILVDERDAASRNLALEPGMKERNLALKPGMEERSELENLRDVLTDLKKK